jgi:hypothetical protein
LQQQILRFEILFPGPNVTKLFTAVTRVIVLNKLNLLLKIIL